MADQHAVQAGHPEDRMADGPDVRPRAVTRSRGIWGIASLSMDATGTRAVVN